MTLRYLTAGESHGKALVAILDGCPANLPLLEKEINHDLALRQQGYGRGGRMKIEKDTINILSGVRFGKTLGSPIALTVTNLDWGNWIDIMSVEPRSKGQVAEVTQLRPGHADLAGSLKYDQTDARNILERASARETAMRVAVGAVARKLLSEFGIKVSSKVVEIGNKKEEAKWKKAIDKAKEAGNTLGGIFEVVATGLPIGLGSYVEWDTRLDGRLAQSVMAIPAIKGVEIGLGFEAAKKLGSEVHDEIFYTKTKGLFHKTNNAGGLEGGITNGEPLVIRAAMKPISTLLNPLHSVDLKTKKAVKAHIERSDACAVEAAAVIGEAVVAFELAKAFLEKFGSDSLEDIKASFSAYLKRLNS